MGEQPLQVKGYSLGTPKSSVVYMQYMVVVSMQSKTAQHLGALFLK